MIKPATVADIVGADLSLFHIEIMTEVYRTDVDERRTESIGFFKLQAIATEFAKRQSDALYCKTESAFVLTDGVTGFVISDQLPITIMDDEAEAEKIRQQLLGTLSKTESDILLGKFKIPDNL